MNTLTAAQNPANKPLLKNLYNSTTYIHMYIHPLMNLCRFQFRTTQGLGMHFIPIAQSIIQLNSSIQLLAYINNKRARWSHFRGSWPSKGGIKAHNVKIRARKISWNWCVHFFLVRKIECIFSWWQLKFWQIKIGFKKLQRICLEFKQIWQWHGFRKKCHIC